MNSKKVILPLLLSLAAAPVFAGHGNKHGHDKHGYHKKDRAPQSAVVMARVTAVEPIVEVVQVAQPRRECWDEEVSGTTTHHSTGGMVLGAIIGGVIGNNVGNGRHRDTNRAIGTVVGGAIGHDSDHAYSRPYSYTEQHCSVSTDYIEEERTLGYRVSYQFQGEEYTTRMESDPGRYVRVQVSHRLLD